MGGILEQWLENLMAKSSGKDLPVAPFNEMTQKIRKLKSKLIRDESGRIFCQSATFKELLAQLDEEGLTGIVDELWADALLIDPNSYDKYTFGCRLIDRGRYKEAKSLFVQVAQEPQLSANAFKSLAKIAERDNNTVETLQRLEQCLAWDYKDTWAQDTLNRLRQNWGGEKSRQSNYRMASLIRGAKIIGSQYRLRSYLGRGGAATVYHGEVNGSHQQVAIKVYHRTQGIYRHQEKALAEARFTAQIKHPHVVTIYDVIPEKGFLVMAYCPEGTLREMLRKKKLNVDQAIDLAMVLLRTLGDIHKLGFAHLDIKPSNILLKNGLPLLSDFGIAAKQPKEGSGGTHAYMAPEQKKGQIGQANDVYALGLVLYECFTGAQLKNPSQPICLPKLPDGPQRHAVETLLSQMLDLEAKKRPFQLHRLAEAFWGVAALPSTGDECLILLDKLGAWAETQDGPIRRSFESHPIIASLSALDLKGNRSPTRSKEIQ